MSENKENRVIKKAKENREVLASMEQKASLSDTFTQALVGFLPLIAGLGSSEDMAAVAPVGLQAMQGLSEQQARERAQANAMNSDALSNAQSAVEAEDKLALEGKKLTSADDRAKAERESRENIAKGNRESQEGIASKNRQNQKDMAGLKEKAAAFDVEGQKQDARKYSDWNATGRGSSKESIATLEQAIANLDKNRSLSGGYTGSAHRIFTNQEVIDQRQNVTRALIAGVKSNFPGALSEKETELFISSHYDEMASPEQNLKTLKVAVNKMKEGAAALEAIPAKYNKKSEPGANDTEKRRQKYEMLKNKKAGK